MKFRRILALILALVMCAMLAGCSDSGTNDGSVNTGSGDVAGGPETTGGNDIDAPAFKIGGNNWNQGINTQDNMCRYTEFAARALGCDVMIVNDEANTEKQISNIQSMISSGVNGIVFFSLSDNLALTVGQLCEEAGVALVINCAAIADKEVLDTLRSYKTFVGVVSDNHVSAGADMANYALEQGYESVIFTGADYGSYTQDAKINEFGNVFTAAGKSVLGEARFSTADSAGMTQIIEDLIVAYPDADCIYCPLSMAAPKILNALDKYNIDMNVLITDVDAGMVNYINDGSVKCANYSSFADNIFSVILLYNYLAGNPILDENGQAPYLEEVPTGVISEEFTKLYQQFWIEDVPFSADYIRGLSYPFAESVTYDDFVSEVRNYSFESVIKTKCEEGLVSQEELTALGIE